MKFEELNLCDSVQEGLRVMNFTEMTPVQEKTIPVIMQKRDVIGCAQTGTGKTAAFILPLLHNLQSEAHDESKVNAIIMAPTRELAQQIDQQMEGFSFYTPFSSVAVYGGNDAVAWDVQKRGLTHGADVVIATPGRLISHISLYDVDFSGVKYFILDEADRMLDMGFFDDIMKVALKLPKEKQTIMFSATMPPRINELAKSIMNNPEEVKIAVSRPPESIAQSAYICSEFQKNGIIRDIFADSEPNKVLIFSGSKLKVKELAVSLRSRGFNTAAMHSDLEQSEREKVMHEFRNNRINMLIATDIVSRGIDIDDISMVINYDVPRDVEDYVHRIGRTARANAQGASITLVSEKEQYLFARIEKFLKREVEKKPVPEILGAAPKYEPDKQPKPQGKFNRTHNNFSAKRHNSNKRRPRPKQ
ncbi:MAG: DEAD/DEAH box helicase [Paludibacter sp.]|jgi:superfamily II DNA/RNA helicase|nr:DEAD/DEAH box helicase [Paludibacter sp.]